jgi:hypothetical protein
VVVLLVLSLSLSDGLVFSMEASLAAGERSPAPGGDVDDDGPVRRWTMYMKLEVVAWMTLGETA